MDSEIIEKIVNSKKLNYQKMSELVGPYINSRTYDKNITIYIDLNNIVKQLYAPNTLEIFSHIKTNGRLNLVVEIINIIGHYRHFFASRTQKHTRFFLFYSDRESEYHTRVDKDYKELHYSKLHKDNIQYRDVNKTIKSCMDIVKNIVKYVPNAFFIDTGKIEPTLIPHFIMKETNIDHDKSFSLIISNDKIYRQLLKEKDKLLLLELRGVNNSKVISRENVLDNIFSKGTKKDINDFYNITYEVMDIYNLLTDHKDQGYKSVPSYGPVSIVKKLDKLIETMEYSPLKKYDTESMVTSVINNLDSSDDRKSEILNRFKLFNHNYVIDQVNGPYLQNVLTSQILNFDDPKELKRLNEEVFEHSYINIDYLFEGEINR